MKKNLIISTVVVSTILLGSVTVFAGNMIAKKAVCPNCGTEVEIQADAHVRGGFGGRQFGKHNFDKKAEPKTLDELKAELTTQVAEGKLTQEQADKRIANYGKRQENAKKREEAQAKHKEGYKAKLAEKVTKGEITQEEADKLLENYGKRGNFRRNFKAKTLEEYKAELAEKVTKSEITQEEADKLIEEYERRIAKFKEMAAKKDENKDGNEDKAAK